MIISCVSRTTSRNPALLTIALIISTYWPVLISSPHIRTPHHIITTTFQPAQGNLFSRPGWFGVSMFCPGLFTVVCLWEFHCMIFTIVSAMKLPSYNSLQRLSKLQADDCAVEIMLHYPVFVRWPGRSRSTLHTSILIFILSCSEIFILIVDILVCLLVLLG